MGFGAMFGGGWRGSHMKVAAVVEELPAQINLTVIGDSIAWGQGGDPGFVAVVTANYPAEHVTLANHAFPYARVLNDMATQVAVAASDNADTIITQLGTNDEADSFAVAYQSGLEALHVSNPNAKIYCMAPLNRSYEPNRAVHSLSVRTAVTGAVAAGVPAVYWDTEDWVIYPGDLNEDGVHPNTTGHAKIAAQVLARL
jgi:hypothetical protein